VWSHVENDLKELLSQRLYKDLLPDPVYHNFVLNAGIDPRRPPEKLSQSLRDKLAMQAVVRARVIVRTIEQSGGINGDGASVKVQKGGIFLRFWDSELSSRKGVWWFSSRLIEECKREAGSYPIQRLSWLRDKLAICHDWSGMDKLDVCTLSEDEEIIAIVGKGTPQPIWSRSAAGRTPPGIIEYTRSLGKYFVGGVPQMVLPFLPRTQTGVDISAYLGKR